MPAIKGAVYINTHCNYSQPVLPKLYKENIGGHPYTFNGALIIISWTSVNRLISQTAHPSWNKNLAVTGWRTRAERRDIAAAIRMQKTDIKVGFQAAVCNTRNVCTRKVQRTQRRINTWVVFHVHALCISVFDCVASHASIALRLLCCMCCVRQLRNRMIHWLIRVM